MCTWPVCSTLVTDSIEPSSHLRQRLLAGLALGRVLHRLAEFHEAGGMRPVAAARLDGAAAEQDAARMLDHAAGDDARILVMHLAAALAHRALALVARRNADTGPGGRRTDSVS